VAEGTEKRKPLERARILCCEKPKCGSHRNSFQRHELEKKRNLCGGKREVNWSRGEERKSLRGVNDRLESSAVRKLHQRSNWKKNKNKNCKFTVTGEPDIKKRGKGGNNRPAVVGGRNQFLKFL